MEQQTAVEWLIRKLSTELIGEIQLHRWDEIRNVIQQAKQMEKEQISKAWDDGDYAYFYSKETGRDFDNGEEYYNEKFKTK